MTAILSHSGRTTRHTRPLAWRGRIERSRQAPHHPVPRHATQCQPEAIVMKPAIAIPSLKAFLALVVMTAGLVATVVLLPVIMPNFASPVSATNIAANIFSAKRACMRADDASADFSAFCDDNFAELNRGFYLKARNEIDVPGRSIAVNSDHPVNRFFQIGANADEMFGSSSQMLENRVAAYTHVECAINDAQAKGLAGFNAIKWTFDPDIKPNCLTIIKIEYVKN
jgi:hypothetical protein